MKINIALAGNPNSGKTTMFNALTGSAQYVGNWPGVTVEKKEGTVKGDKDTNIIDLPGIYSLSPYTLEEVVSRDYLLTEKPDVIIDMVDASNIERNLYLTTQVLELGIPVVIALNMIDVVRKRGDVIDIKKLEKRLGCKVVETSALKGIGLKELIEECKKAADIKESKPVHNFNSDVEAALSEIESSVSSLQDNPNARWFAIKLLEQDIKVMETFQYGPGEKEKVDIIRERLEKAHDDDGESIITNERYLFIGDVVSDTVKKKHVGMTTSDKIDRIVTNRFLALPIFAAVMFLVYYVSISTIGTWGTDWVNDVLFGEIVPDNLNAFLEGIGTSEMVQSLIVDGIVGGVGAVLGFLPQIIVLFLCLSILEDIGYMARIAFIMDRIFRKFGLSGKSFIPILIGTGCSVPGIIGTRTIENDKDRRMTIIVTSFMPCSAKIPIIALITAAFFDGKFWVAPLAYFTAILGIIVSGIILKKTSLFAGDPAPFVMELPQYHAPSPKNVIRHTYDRAKAFVVKAGTIILAATVVIWFLMSFTPSFEYISFEDDSSGSLLGIIGSAIAPLFAPLGFGKWEPTVATFTGLIAKEQLVSTLSVITGGAADLDPDAVSEAGDLLSTFGGMLTALGGFSFLIFNLFNTPCFAAIGAIRREMDSPKWTFFAIAYQLVFSYAVSLVIFQIGSLILGQATFGLWSVIAIIVAICMLFLLFRSYNPGKDKFKPAIANN
ncbi:MAG: ferrous iron transport protein B [Andreesenia angusta]|nr:ferrous iron transport protein B [Andreesenia angusta]